MPRRKFTKKRSTRRNFRSSNKWMNVAAKALKTAKFVKSLINTEYKYYDVSANAVAQPWTGGIAPLCLPSQGVQANQRTGDSIKMKNLTFRGQWTQNTTINEVVRLMIYIDKENNITTGANLLEVASSANAVFSPKNNNNRYDTKILYDRTFNISSDNPVQKVEFTIPLDIHQHFDAATNTVDRNALRVACFTQQALSGSFFQYYSRVTYVDN